jgi:hypothetical protein
MSRSLDFNDSRNAGEKVLKVVETPGVGKGVVACSSKVISRACFLVALIGRKTDSGRPSKASVDPVIVINISFSSGLYRKDDIGPAFE